jgi:zinc/manganese transport system permease protein
MFDALQLPFFQWAALAALVLAGIHAYLGFHIVRRGVLFVDLALAQMAALGVSLAIVLGHEHDEVGSYLLALGMTILGAALFAWLRGRARHAPLEAFIGIVFATAQALAFLLLEKTPTGPEHLKETLVGSLFTVEPGRIAVVAALYTIVALVHVFLRKPFLEITHDPEGAASRGRNLFLWDFLFYVTFGVVVTSAVQNRGCTARIRIPRDSGGRGRARHVAHRRRARGGVGVRHRRQRRGSAHERVIRPAGRTEHPRDAVRPARGAGLVQAVTRMVRD